MSLSNKNDKKSGLNETFLALVVIGLITTVAALYKFNAAKEWVDSKKEQSIKVESVQREQYLENRGQTVDKYVNDYAEGAAWALKNEVVDPEECDDPSTSSVKNLGCMAAAAEVREKMERQAYRGMSRSEAEDALESESLSPEEAMYSEAYLEPEIN